MPARSPLPAFSPLQTRAVALADPAFFDERGRFKHLFFGQIPTGENLRHRVVFDAAKKRAFCSCPFFPKPCVHALAMTRLAEQPEFFPETNTPPHWAESRRSEAVSHDAHLREAAPRDARLERAGGGLEDLEAWLLDLLRRGLAAAVSEDPHFVEGIAARAADASLTGVSRRLRLLASLSPNAPGWAEYILAALADCYLAVRAFRRRHDLPGALRYDLQAFLGIAGRKDEVLAAGERLHDTWAVLGRREETLENQLSARRTWLLGTLSGRYALLLDHAFGNAAGFPPGFSPGTLVKGELVFYPSAYPQRALAGEDLQTLPQKAENLPGFLHFDAFAAAYAAALGAQPWLAVFPAFFPAVRPALQQKRFLVVDEAGRALPLAGPDAEDWKLLALSGGRPLGIFGEWDGAALRVLSAMAQGRMVV